MARFVRRVRDMDWQVIQTHSKGYTMQTNAQTERYFFGGRNGSFFKD